MTTAPTAAGEGTAVEIYSPGADTSGRLGPVIWSGRVPNGDPEAIFRFFNRVDAADAERLRAIGYRLPSLSVGDIISYTGKTASSSFAPPDSATSTRRQSNRSSTRRTRISRRGSTR